MKSRREFLQQLALAGALGGVIAACKSKPALLDCTDASALSDADKQMRTTLQYADKSPDPAKVCSGCNFFQKPAMADICGGCTLVKGPINAGGHCTSWVQKAA
jgi:hypothetical protein